MNRRGFIGKMVGGAVAAAGVAACSTGFVRVAKSRAAATSPLSVDDCGRAHGVPTTFVEVADFWTPNSVRTQTLNASWFMQEPKA